MKGSPGWIRLVIGLALIATLALVVPALGGPSLSKLVKKQVRKEVSKQIKKATGPAGAAGAPGTALAYARVNGEGTPVTVDAANSKNVANSNVARGSHGGIYCFSGLSFTPHSVVANVDNNSNDAAAATVELGHTSGTCPAGTAVTVGIRTYTGISADVNFFVVFN
jgi:hypothetical protein